MVDAAIDFYASGKVIERPREVLEKTAIVNNSMDSIKQFIEDACELRPEEDPEPHNETDERYSVRPSIMFQAYSGWIRTQGLDQKKLSRNQFPKSLAETRGVHKRRFHGIDYWVGIRLI